MLNWLFGGVSRSEYYALLDLLVQKDEEIAALAKHNEDLEDRVSALESVSPDIEYEIEKFLNSNLYEYVKDILKDAVIDISL